ncbi:hypothetical protein DAPPUDRAFT_247768 [Daphnia pulex]|uniref:Uncharacterized protein n=1 Tax=Daphnia pulex TaxID=6669 RepID=E9GTC1_DAPPU|nr:hypothetical protein DAPPUDRAFT_247768 [Daphnia pulex]|eukprot:EFX77253.1 hypothetical protein DAPPUDRAFT_247768 [Daphnia pulex]
MSSRDADHYTTGRLLGLSKETSEAMFVDVFAFRLTESYQFVPSRKIKGQHHGQKRRALGLRPTRRSATGTHCERFALTGRPQTTQDHVDQFVPFDEKVGEKDNSWDQDQSHPEDGRGQDKVGNIGHVGIRNQWLAGPANQATL